MKYLLLLLHTAVRHTLGKFYLSSPLFYFIVRARSECLSVHMGSQSKVQDSQDPSQEHSQSWLRLDPSFPCFPFIFSTSSSSLFFFFFLFFSTTTCTIQALVKTRENQTERTNFVPTEFSPHSKGLLPPATPEYCYLNGKVSTILSLIVF